ncbi:MAG: phosphotransferase [Candidatus Woesebacteria bacterium]|nr:phosphotransferase [Candidatus Woesebacteria bacterium]
MSERITYFPEQNRNIEFSVPQIEIGIHNRSVAPFTRNTILFGVTKYGTQTIIKIFANRNGLLNEWEGLNMAYNAGLPVPEPYALAKNSDGVQVLISQKIDGELLHTNSQPSIRYELGKIVSFMHNQVRINGKDWASTGKTNFSYYESLLNKYLKSSLSELKTGSETHTILNKFVNIMSYYCKTTSPVFNHNDLHDGQIIIKPNHKLVLLDFENWKEETQLNEISYYLFHSIKDGSVNRNFDKFINGYLKSDSLTDTEKSVMTFYLIFISARAIDYFKNTGSKYLQKALETHKKVLSYTNDERLWKDY